MNFPLGRKGKKSQQPLFLFVGLVILIFLFWQITALSRLLSRTAFFFATPFLLGEAYFKEHAAFYYSFFASKSALTEENKQLKEQADILEAQLVEKNLIVQENEELKDVLGRKSLQMRTILATVLSKPNRSPYDTLILDIGTNDGVYKGNIVLAPGDIAIGTVEYVEAHNARAKLFSSPGEKNDVMIGKNNIFAVAIGVGGGNFEIKLPRGISIMQGDNIFFPSMKSTILGIVEIVEMKPTDSLQTIRFKNPINIFELKWVNVVL